VGQGAGESWEMALIRDTVSDSDITPYSVGTVREGKGRIVKGKSMGNRDQNRARNRKNKKWFNASLRH
jgi:hypothetical protein